MYISSAKTLFYLPSSSCGVLPFGASLLFFSCFDRDVLKKLNDPERKRFSIITMGVIEK